MLHVLKIYRDPPGSSGAETLAGDDLADCLAKLRGLPSGESLAAVRALLPRLSAADLLELDMSVSDQIRAQLPALPFGPLTVSQTLPIEIAEPDVLDFTGPYLAGAVDGKLVQEDDDDQDDDPDRTALETVAPPTPEQIAEANAFFAAESYRDRS